MTDILTLMSGIDRNKLAKLLARERDEYVRIRPRSQAAFAHGEHLFGRVPMTWMLKLAGQFPIYFEKAHGATLTDIDGRTYADFSLGDTAAMAGHSPAPTVAAVVRRYRELGGASVMLPTEDAEVVGAELTRRFGAARWSFALSATDANRWAIRLVRALTGRPKILFNSYCYHGSVDESLIVVDGRGAGVPREGNVGAPVDVRATSRVAEFNDLNGLEAQLAAGDVAAVLMEPALTNIGIVLPEPGYLDGVRRLTREHGTLLIIDETHTFSAGPGGCCAAWGLDPDVVVVGKAIGGGVPAAAYGLAAELADRLLARTDLDLVDMGGVGGTLAGNALSIAATRATLTEVLTDAAFEHMIELAATYTDGARTLFAECGVPWNISQLGARAEFQFQATPALSGGEANATMDPELDDYLHVYLANRDVLLTPFHDMALMSPATSPKQVEVLLDVLGAAVRELVA